MAKTDIAMRLENLLEPIAEEHGFELVAVEQAGGRHTPIIRVLLDREDGINLDAICEANGWVGEAIEGYEGLSGPFTLEVSSPGIDRPLRKLSDFERFVGEAATVKVRAVGSVRSSWSGVIERVESDVVVLLVDGEETRIPFNDIIKARLKGVVSFNRERGTRS